MIDKIQRKKHTVRDTYGDSNLTYVGDTIPEDFRHFIMGLFQGNGSAPQILPIISYVLFSALRAQGFGIYFVNYFTTKISQLVGFSYVDDCDMVQSDDDIEATNSKM